MEILVIILLAFIAYQLYKIANQRERNNSKSLHKSKSIPDKSPAFSKNEWDEAVSAWYERQHKKDRDAGMIGMPGYSVWMPPSYDEVKYDLHKLKNLRAMAGLRDNQQED
jgi:hypothetical protein